MLLPSAKRAKLKSNEVCNAVRSNENSTPALKKGFAVLCQYYSHWNRFKLR